METLGVAKENSKIDALFWMIMGAFGVSTTTFVGQNYGARKYDRVRKSVRVCLALSLAATLLISAVLLLLGPHVFRLLTEDAGVVRHNSLTTVMLSYPVTWSITSLLFVVY